MSFCSISLFFINLGGAAALSSAAGGVATAVADGVAPAVFFYVIKIGASLPPPPSELAPLPLPLFIFDRTVMVTIARCQCCAVVRKLYRRLKLL